VYPISVIFSILEKMRKVSIYFLCILGFPFLFSCSQNKEEVAKAEEKEKIVDLSELKEAGHLRALIDNSSTSYFVYRGEPMGNLGYIKNR
jgi:membrane-bound lytic murein transglycosylase F